MFGTRALVKTAELCWYWKDEHCLLSCMYDVITRHRLNVGLQECRSSQHREVQSLNRQIAEDTNETYKGNIFI